MTCYLCEHLLLNCRLYALLQVANMAFYSPDRAYGGRVDYMAHEDVMGLEGMQN
jgi:hypothetical protein